MTACIGSVCRWSDALPPGAEKGATSPLSTVRDCLKNVLAALQCIAFVCLGEIHRQAKPETARLS